MEFSIGLMLFLSGLISKIAIWTAVLLFNGYQPSTGSDNNHIDVADVTILDEGHTLGVSIVAGEDYFDVRRFERDGENENIVDELIQQSGEKPMLATAADGMTMLVYNDGGDVKFKLRDKDGNWCYEGEVIDDATFKDAILKASKVFGAFWLFLYDDDDGKLKIFKHEGGKGKEWELVYEEEIEGVVDMHVALKESSPAKILFGYITLVGDEFSVNVVHYDEDTETFESKEPDILSVDDYPEGFSRVGFCCSDDDGTAIWLRKEGGRFSIKAKKFNAIVAEWGSAEEIETFPVDDDITGFTMASDPLAGCCLLAWIRKTSERGYLETKTYDCGLGSWRKTVKVAEINLINPDVEFKYPELAVDEDGQFTLVWQLVVLEEKTLMTAASDECGKSWSQAAPLECGEDPILKHKLVVRKNMAKILVETRGEDLPPTGAPTSNYYVFDRTSKPPCDKHSYKTVVQKCNFNFFDGLNSYFDWVDLQFPEGFQLKFFQNTDVNMHNGVPIHHKESGYGNDEYMFRVEDSGGNHLLGPFKVNCK